MDFMNFMNQFSGMGFGNNNSGCGCDLGQGFSNDNCTKLKSDNLLPLLLLMGLGQQGNNFSGGTLTCYPNNQCQQPQPFVMPTSDSFCGPNVKYRRRKVRQAYMEVPVSTYQVAQPFPSIMPQAQPTTMNIIPNNISSGRNIDFITLLLLMLCNNSNCRQSNQSHVGCNVSSEI